MPQTYKKLREIIGDKTEAIEVLCLSGWKVEEGVITPPEEEVLVNYTRGQQMDARDYLVEEWDFTQPDEDESERPDSLVEMLGYAIAAFEHDEPKQGLGWIMAAQSMIAGKPDEEDEEDCNGKSCFHCFLDSISHAIDSGELDSAKERIEALRGRLLGVDR